MSVSNITSLPSSQKTIDFKVKYKTEVFFFNHIEMQVLVRKRILSL